MPIVQELSRKQIQECLAEAIHRQVPVAMTCRTGAQWHNLHTRLLNNSGQGLWVAQPTCEHASAPPIAEGLGVGLSFKLKHHKHILNTVVEAVGEFGLVGTEKTRALCLAVPHHMQRVQRRAYHRVQVPRSRSVLASFWQGGLSASQRADDTPVTWEGWVTNISAGGFQVRLGRRSAPELDIGDLVGVRVDLGQEYRQILADCQFRQQSTDPRGVAFQGFQFIGLNETARGREMLRRIGQVVAEFQRLQGHSSVA